jgi:hypothetical protein
MSRWRPGPVLRALIAMLATVAVAAPALGNGDTQRQVRGRVASVDVQGGTLVVDRVFRGRATRVALRVPPGTKIFTCGEERPALDRVRAGTVVSVFYEVLGAEGVANLVVVEPEP